MCGHCRAIVLGAFVVGALAGALTGSLMLDKKYKEAYAREVEAARAAAKRVIKGLRVKLEDKTTYHLVMDEKAKEELDAEEELEGQESFESYLDKVKENYLEGKTETKSENFPEGFFECETREEISGGPIQAQPLMKRVSWPQDEDTIDYRYVPSMNKWFNGDGDPRSEGQVRDILSEEGLKAAYEAAVDTECAVQIRGYLVVFKGLDE